MVGLLDQALDDANLFEAWLKVRANKGAAGVDGQTIEQFAVNVFGRLQTLRDHVRRGEYRPMALLRVAIPKPNGKLRYLAIPTVRDRVLQTAVARVITPLLDRAFEHASYGYRSGHSVAKAVARVAHWRDQGYHWVVDADIQSYFDNIDHALLLDKLRRTIQDHSLLPLIELWLSATVQPADPAEQPFLLTKGLPQGSPLSPVLANLYLDDLDEALLERDLRLVRFADDFVILCRDPAQAQQALRLTEEVIEALKLRINRDKTRLVSFDEGFRFLGVNFVRNLMVAADPAAAPWVLPDDETRREAHQPSSTPPDEAQEETAVAAAPAAPRRPVRASDAIPQTIEPTPSAPAASETDADDWLGQGAPEGSVRIERHEGFSPLLRSLVIAQHGVLVLKENERVVVAARGEQILSWPLRKLDEIHILGNALISSALLRHCADEGVTVALSDASGGLHAIVGRAQPVADAQRHAQQWQRTLDADWALMAGRAMVHGKLSNQLTLLRRYNRRRQIPAVEQAIGDITAMRQRLPHTRDLNAVRGCEGHAAHAYYGALRQLIPENWRFEGRRKRPPTDPVNALLSFGYAILHRTMVTLILRQGLDPYLGTLHAPRAGHAALASDLIEEFRAPVVDSVVMATVLGERIQPSDFVLGEDGQTCLLNEHARRTFVRDLTDKLRSALLHPVAKVRMDYHRAMHWQVHHYRQVVEGQLLVYEPFVLR
jgi:CRISPR-associated protein Cas1